MPDGQDPPVHPWSRPCITPDRVLSDCQAPISLHNQVDPTTLDGTASPEDAVEVFKNAVRPEVGEEPPMQGRFPLSLQWHALTRAQPSESCRVLVLARSAWGRPPAWSVIRGLGEDLAGTVAPSDNFETVAASSRTSSRGVIEGWAPCSAPRRQPTSTPPQRLWSSPPSRPVRLSILSAIIHTKEHGHGPQRWRSRAYTIRSSVAERLLEIRRYARDPRSSGSAGRWSN